MKTPYLSPEIYSRASDPAVNKDKAVQRKQANGKSHHTITQMKGVFRIFCDASVWMLA